MHAKIYSRCHYYAIHTKISAWQNIFELALLCYTYTKSLHDKIYLSCHYVIHTTNHCMTKYIWVFIICYTYYKSLHDIIYLGWHYYVKHNTNHCMTKYIWVVIIMLYILQIIAWQNIFELPLLCYHLQIIAWQNIFELSLLCYTYYKSLHAKIYSRCHYYVIHTKNHCITKYIWVIIIMLHMLQIIAWQNIFDSSLLCYTYYKSLHDKIYLSCHYYDMHSTHHSMTWYIWVVSIMLYILQTIAWQNIFELPILCYTYYKSLHDKIYLSCHYFVIHNTNHCMTKYIWVGIIMLYIHQIIAWQNIFGLSVLCYTYYKSLHNKLYFSCHYYFIHITNHCMTKYIWGFHYLLYILRNIAWQNIFELSLLCYTYYKSMHGKIYLIRHYYVIHSTNHWMAKYIWVDNIMLYIIQIVAWQNILVLPLLCYT